MPRRSPPRWYDHLLHVLGILLIGGAFCYWLAKYLTAPLAKLRIATHELARGNLAARVGPSTGKRRDELISLGSDFDLMAEQIESLVEAQRRLLGDISHELRSPLARLNIALELARQRAGLEATSALERIQHEAENLNEMIGQLLALTRLETGAGEFRRNRFDLAKLDWSATLQRTRISRRAAATDQRKLILPRAAQSPATKGYFAPPSKTSSATPFNTQRKELRLKSTSSLALKS